jgi:predicted AlkP superfamily phosphohydrolase/phosphomutase
MSGGAPTFRKVVVVGLDGLEPTILGPLLDSGALPNLARVVGSGGLARVATTTPAQTPVAWSTFATGANPGGHGIFDFIARDPATLRPDLALNRYEQKSAWLPPRAVNLRRGTPFWEHLGAKGIGSTVLRCPCTYPATLGRGRLLAGMGVPDLRGGLGTPTFLSTAPGLAPRESEMVVPLDRPASGPIPAYLVGPRTPKEREGARFALSLALEPGSPGLTIRSEGTPATLAVRPGEWSDWLRVRFKIGPLQALKGMVRFYLVRSEPELELYASPINFDPDRPPFPISAPAGYAQELVEGLGTYYTTGMVEDHTGLNNGRLDEPAFLAQCDEVWNEREAMMLRELARLDEGFFYVLFDTPDRVQHMFWRYREPDHPAHRGESPSGEFARVVEDQYRRADAVLGRALEFVDDRTLLIALSDHGFGSFRRGVDLNAWLRDQGLLAVRDGAEGAEFPENLDWSRTRAYALGLGGIYLNLAGREARGIVPPDEADALAARIAGGLAGLIDPEAGAVAVRSVRTRGELYRGPFAGESPDLVAHFSRGYRVSWGASLGGVGGVLVEDNTQKWSGDHIFDPALVPGFLAMNRPFRGDSASLLDLAPTILDALGVGGEGEWEGRSLLG